MSVLSVATSDDLSAAESVVWVMTVLVVLVTAESVVSVTEVLVVVASESVITAIVGSLELVKNEKYVATAILDVAASDTCSEKLHLQSYLEMLWSETGYFGLLGNNLILFIILLYLIER